jgi:hypothetical protein
MFQSISNFHLQGRIRSGRRKVHFELNPETERQAVGVTNLFILATAALTTILPRNEETFSRLHANLDAIHDGLSRLHDDIKHGESSRIVRDLEELSHDILAAASDAGQKGSELREVEILALSFYIKHAMVR